MKKLFLILLAFALAMVALTAGAEDNTVAATNERIEKDEFGNTVIVEDVDLDALEEEEEDDYPIPLEDDEDDYIEEEPEEEIIEWVDLDAEDLIFPELYCEVLEDTFELAEAAPGAKITGGHYKGELLTVVDLTGEYWLLQDGCYVSADDVAIYNEDDIPGEAEIRTVVNPRIPRNMKVVLCPIASDIDSIVEDFHSVVIYDTIEKRLHCYKLGVETLEISLEPLNELSQLYSYWSIDEDFLQEDAYAIGWGGVMEKIYQYTLPGSYFVIFH